MIGLVKSHERSPATLLFDAGGTPQMQLQHIENMHAARAMLCFASFFKVLHMAIYASQANLRNRAAGDTGTFCLPSLRGVCAKFSIRRRDALKASPSRTKTVVAARDSQTSVRASPSLPPIVRARVSVLFSPLPCLACACCWPPNIFPLDAIFLFVPFFCPFFRPLFWYLIVLGTFFWYTF